MSITKTTTTVDTLKINYLTQEMYEDALENDEINANEIYLTPSTDFQSTTATLTVAGWSSSSQTVSVSEITVTSIIIVSPAPASYDDYTSAGIYCSAQGSNTLTFTCTTTPSNAITVNILYR